jgi:adenosylcobinamide-GDP ribazoletransferase
MMMTALPYVRTEGGLVTVFSKGKIRLGVLWSVVFLIVAGWIAAQWIGIAACLSSILVTALFSIYCLRKIGGYTGDTLGAVSEITEIIPALAAIAMRGMVS